VSTNVRIVDMRAAMGGDDAAKFCYELRRAYLRYAIKRGWKADILDESVPGNGLIKSSTLRISGKGVDALSAEAGTHRVTRIPINEKTGRRHTSAVTVAILEVPERVSVVLNASDVQIDTFRGTGPGGQHRNKTDSAVRATHVPTGLVAVAQDDRSQHVNKERALEVLAARVTERKSTAMTEVRERKRARDHGRGHIAERQRSYLWREGVAVDHTSGVRVPLTRALNGDLFEFAR
jgi:peptide chain release factor 1